VEILSQSDQWGNPSGETRDSFDLGARQYKWKGGGDTKRRIEITVEKRRLIVLKRQRRSVPDWCADCGEQVAMLTPDQAATIANVSSRTIYRRVEAGEMHYLETAEGRLLVCANSIELNSKVAPQGAE